MWVESNTLQYLGCTRILAFCHFEPFKSHLLDLMFCGLSYHLEMLELREHRSPIGKGVPTEGLHSGFLEAWCWRFLNHRVHRKSLHRNQGALCCSGEPVKSQTKPTNQCLIKTQFPNSLCKGPTLSRYLRDAAKRKFDWFVKRFPL